MRHLQVANLDFVIAKEAIRVFRSGIGDGLMILHGTDEVLGVAFLPRLITDNEAIPALARLRGLDFHPTDIALNIVRTGQEKRAAH